MKSTFLLLAALLSPVLLSPLVAHAQSDDERCPQLPAGGGLAWEVSEGPDFLYCKAMRDGDGSQAFAVMLREESDFRGDRGLRDAAAVIDGHKVRWYRGDLAMPTNVLVRETLLELGRNSTAHIVVRARSEEQLAENRRLAEGLRFGGSAVGGD